MLRKMIILSVVTITAFVISACGGAASDSAKKIGETKINDKLTVSLLSADGKLQNGEQTLTLKFTDGSGNPVEMKAASLNFMMPAMGSMSEMNDSATLSTSGTPGEFSAKVKLQMAGEWIAQIGYEGAETGKTTIKVTAR